MRRSPLALLLVLAACAGDPGTQVTLTDVRSFDPPTLTIGVGDSVTWTNESDEQHTVTAYEASIPDGAAYFSSGGAGSESRARESLAAGLFGPGEAVSIEFETSGTYEYFCIPHEDQGMKGEIVVED